MTDAALYRAEIVHVRHRPVRHRLRQRAFYLVIDIDRAAAVADRLRLFSTGRFNLVAWFARDHGDASTRPLRSQVEAHLQRAGIDIGGGPIRLLCMPRVLGLAFNPLSVFFCHRAGGGLAAILYEVTNTFGQRHSYLVPVEGDAGSDPRRSLRHCCAKAFYVSPFMPMDLTYRFRLSEPDERLRLGITAHDAAGPVLTAMLSGERRDLSDRALLRALLATPMLALQVLGAIHWQALLLWRKGVRLQPRPAPPADPVSLPSKAQS